MNTLTTTFSETFFDKLSRVFLDTFGRTAEHQEENSPELPVSSRLSKDIGREIGRYDQPTSIESFGPGYF